ncbi:GtrA family protein [Bacillus rhizoplanae]|uniref:GtrA family protein n=1 Tax=Bacillus rhizoplanae TaxID=2880966 RepID=UPI003D1E3EFD
MGKFLKFGLVGLFNTAITIITYMILVKLGVYYIAANTIAYLLGVVNSYYWNKNWVFQATNNSLSIFMKFTVVNLIVLGFNTLSLFILVDKFSIHEFIAQIFAIGVGMFINFFLNKTWTFDKEKKPY